MLVFYRPTQVEVLEMKTVRYQIKIIIVKIDIRLDTAVKYNSELKIQQ